MSWVVEEWKEGLSTKVLHKIQELESQLEKFKKERQQKQFQLESLEAALQKQKQKVDQEKNEGSTLKRENQNLMELCDNLENTRQKLAHDLQVKELQVNFQEGQLISSKKQIENLEQELKRYKSELEKHQKIHVAGDVSFNSTPQRNLITSSTPSDNDSKYEELQAKYSKEVEERRRLEAELKSLKSQKTNTTCPESMISRREIARQQASSSVFSWQQEKTPSRFSSSPQETPISSGSVTSHRSQEFGATPSHRYLKSTKKGMSNSGIFSSKDSPLLKMKAQNQELRSRIQELEHKLQSQTQDMKLGLTKLQETQLQLDNLKMELTEKDKALNKTRNEMSRIVAQFDQATDQCAVKEEKVKRLSEDLHCQRQNFESVQRALQEKIKEKEKECQKELVLQLGQVRASLQGELHQAKDSYNILKAKLEKILSEKQEFENKANELTQKLSQADRARQAMQLKENELKNMCEEVKKQNSLISCQAAQQLQEIHQLKEELCIAKQLLQESQHVSEVMKNKNCSLENELMLLEEKLNKQCNSITLENMKLAISDLENQRDSLQQLLKHKENAVEELSMKLSELEMLQKVYAECEGLKKEVEILSQRKKENEQLLNELDSEKGGLQSKISSLEGALKTEQLRSQERIRALEDEKKSLSLEVKNLKCVVEDRTRQLEVQRKANADLQKKNETSEAKHMKEIENSSLKLAEFVKHIDALQEELETCRNKALEKDKCIVSLEASLASYAQLNINLQKQSEELSQARDEMHRKLVEAEQKHTDFVEETGQQINKLQTTLSDKQDLLTKALASLKERDEKLRILIKEPDRQQTVIRNLKMKAILYEDPKQHLKVLSPTISQKELDLTVALSLNNKENEQPTEENSIFKSTSNSLEPKNLDVMQRKLTVSNNLSEKEENLLERSENNWEKSSLLSVAKENMERKCLLLQAKNENLECVLREQTNHLEVQKAKFEIQEKQLKSKFEELELKLVSMDKKNNALHWQLEKTQLVPEVDEMLRQEGAALNKIQYSDSRLLQEKEEQIESMKMRNEHATGALALEQLKVSMKEKEDELHRCQVKLEMLQMDFDDNEVTVKNYIVQVNQLETVLRAMEIKLEENKTEKESLRQELQAFKHLENQTSETSEADGNNQSPIHFDADTKVSFNQEIDANCSSIPYNLIPAQNDHIRLVSCLHMTMNKLNELEKICEHLQIEKSQLKDPQLECIMNADTMAHNLMDKINKVEERATFSGALIDKAEQPAMEHIISPRDYDGIDYEGLKLFNEEIKAHFDNVEEKILSLNNLYQIFQGQSLNMASKISEMQCYIELLKENNIAMSTSLYQVDTVSFEIEMTPSPVDEECQSDEKFCMEVPHYDSISYSTNVTPVESSFDSDLPPPSKIAGLLNNKQADLKGAADQHCHSLPELCNSNRWDSLDKQEHLFTNSPNLKNKIKHLLHEPLDKSFKMLEESFQSHKNLEDKEIQKIQELLLSVRQEVDGLQKQAVSDNKLWQQKLHNVILQVASTLTFEKKYPELLPQEQEGPQPKIEDPGFSCEPLLCTDSKHQARIPAEQANHPSCQLEVYTFCNEISELESVNNKVTARTCEANGIENKGLASEAKICLNSSEKLLSNIDLETRNASNKSIVPTNCPNVLSLSPSHSISAVPMDFLDMPCSEIKHIYSKNAKLSCDLEETSKNIDSLLVEIQNLKSNLDAKDEELVERINACAEMDKAVAVLKQEKIDLSEALKSVTFDNQQLSYNLMTLGIELNKAKADLEMYKVRLCDATDALDDLEMTKADWTEKLLEAENELRRIKSEKANVENHALFMEADIEELQAKNEQLEREKENELKTIFGLQDQLCMITAERNQFTQDLSALSKDKEELDQKCQKMQETIKELESRRVDSTEFIRILEAEAKTQAKLLQAAKAASSQLSTEKEGLTLQLQNLDKVVRDLVLEKEAAQSQVECLREEKEARLQEFETLHSKLSISEIENAKISKSLEGSLIEKGELAARLNSAQEEVDQLRRGIEKLKIKIEADEKSKHRLAEKWKETQRKADSLVDKIESLERELQMSEENLEGAILQAEVAKEEAEAANAEIENMRVTLQRLEHEISALKSEKVCLESMLEEKQVKVSSLESSHVVLLKQVKEEEQKMVKIRGEYERELLSMQSQLNQAHEEIKLSFSKQEILKANEQDEINIVASLRQENTQLVRQLEEGKYRNSEMEQLIEALIQAFQDIMQKMDENSAFFEQLPISESLQAISQESQGSFKLPGEELEAITSEKCASLGKEEQLKKAYISLHHKFQQWLGNYRELKQEKELMMDKIHKLEMQLTMGDLCCHKDTGIEEMEELRGSFEERTVEAENTQEMGKLRDSLEDNSIEADLDLDRFCALLTDHHKLEQENEMWRTQVSLLNARLKQTNIPSSPCQRSHNPVQSNDSNPIKQASSDEVTEITTKKYKSQENRRIDEETTFPLRDAVTKKETAFQHCSPVMLQDRTQYESVVSLEVGEKENGTFCPTVRGKTPQCHQNLRTSQFSKCRDLSEDLEAPAEGSKLQKVNNFHLQEVEVLGSLDFTPRSPLSAFNQSAQADAEQSAECLHSIPTKCSLNSGENELDETCHVQ
uniref:Centromere protein F n=1 Tax=Anolis carolinensis TaxID=28377 RepID=G1KES2_ANOCA|nr:PREDICTED: centromere protein F isoform X1 [Anolis carolinensis]|eukprot:XP_008124053.1 PREDICTED: centromere protein F isoform X1 [Anolis carolinensis]